MPGRQSALKRWLASPRRTAPTSAHFTNGKVEVQR